MGAFGIHHGLKKMQSPSGLPSPEIGFHHLPISLLSAPSPEKMYAVHGDLSGLSARRLRQVPIHDCIALVEGMTNDDE